MRRADWLGLAVVAVSLGGLILYRQNYVEPREWVGQCSAATTIAASNSTSGRSSGEGRDMRRA